ncbi:MAG: flavodoxin-dependent (E)-4-hydroxy-3-methylbut-2-enyl-diphosphate synthase [Paludibaculum sp.]
MWGAGPIKKVMVAIAVHFPGRGLGKTGFPGGRMALIARRKSVVVNIGGVKVGGSNPVVVQSMTNTDTADIKNSYGQPSHGFSQGGVRAGARDGEYGRGGEGRSANRRHVEPVWHEGPHCSHFHYNGHIILKKYPECAEALAKYRINPGNVNIGRKTDDNYRTMIECAIEYGKPVRIGVNWGSLDGALLTRMMDENARSANPLNAADVTKRAIVVSAIESAAMAESYGLPHDKIILSAKVSAVQDLIDVYRMLAGECDLALHLGLTEAGMGAKGIVATTAALSILLQEGIGDTIRASLTPLPNGDRTEESAGLCNRSAIVGHSQFHTAGDGLSRLWTDDESVFQELADQIQTYLREQMPVWKEKYTGVEEMKVAVMGCICERPR